MNQRTDSRRGADGGSRFWGCQGRREYGIVADVADDDLQLALAILGARVLLDDHFAWRLEDDVHHNAVLFYGTLAVLLHEEVKRLGQNPFTSGAKQICLDVLVVGMYYVGPR